MERRRNAVYIIIILSMLAGLATGRSFFFNVAYAFLGLLAVSLLWAWTGANWLRLRRQTRARRAQVGHFVVERFTVQNTSFLPKLWLEVYDSSNLPGHRASHVLSNLAPRRDVSWTVRTRCVRRGAFLLGPLRIVTGDPFGLFQAERQISATSPLIVYPPAVDIVDFALPVGALPGGDALRRRTHQVTTNAAGVRDYAPGDSFSRIHWRSTARKDRLIVKEFELDPMADIWLLMDLDRSIHVGEFNPTEDEIISDSIRDAYPLNIPPTTEEYMVAATASLARYFLQRDRAVGFAAFGSHRETIPADRGPRQLTKIFESLAVVQAQGHVTFDQLAAIEGETLPRGTTVVLVTPSTRPTWVGSAHLLLRRGLRVVSVLIDPRSFGGRPGMEGIAVQLGVMGIPSYLIRQSDDLKTALSQRYV